MSTHPRWPITRFLALFTLLGGGVALAGGLFGRGEPEPEPVVVPQPDAEPPPPPAPVSPPLFADGLPVALQDTPEGLPSLSAQGCASCHWQSHEAWRDGPHAQAWKDAEFQEALARTGQSTACSGCHLPLANQHPRLAAGYESADLARPALTENALWDATLMSEGVTCAACHVREGTVIATRAAPDAPHPVAVSTELHTSELCATCHQLTWPGADKPFYDTYGEWKASPYAEAGVSCQDCHMPAEPGASAASRFAARPSHAFPAHLERGMSVLLDAPSPDVQRGSPWELTVRLQNTGAGHHIPTGSPFKTYSVEVTIEALDGTVIAGPDGIELGRTVAEEPPWDTLSDNRLAPGAELSFAPTLEVSQKIGAQRADLVVRVVRVVPGRDDTADRTPLLERRLPVQVL